MRNLCLIIAMEELTIYMKKRTHTSLLINSFHFLMKYFSFSSVYMLSWYFSCFVHSAWEGVNKRGNFSCLQLPFYCKNLKRIKNANQFISFLFSFLSVSSASVCVLYLFIKRRLRDHDPVLLSYYMQFRPQHGTNCDLFCSSSEASRGGGGGGWMVVGEGGPVYLFQPHPQLVVDGAPNSFESLFIVLKKKCLYLTYRIKPLPFS